MIHHINLTALLLESLTHVEESKDFLQECLITYMNGPRNPIVQGKIIQGDRFERSVQRIAQEVFSTKNIGFEHRVVVNVSWGLVPEVGFGCVLDIGLRDFDVSSYGVNLVKAPLVCQ